MSTLLTVVLLNIFSTSYGLVCYRCDKQSDLNQCQSAIECRPDEICHGFISEDHNPIRYTLGCIPRTICEKYIFGKRGQFSSGCCRTDYCNLDMVKPNIQSTTMAPTTKVTTKYTTTQGTTLRPKCVDHDSQCSNSAYKARLCDPNAQPDIKDLAVRTCPVACNYCSEWNDAGNRTFCHTCGKNTPFLLPCAAENVFDLTSSTLQICSKEQKFCMTDYFVDSMGNQDIVKRCVDEAICHQKWFIESSDLDYCNRFGNVTMFYGNQYQCHFCCKGNGCNTNIKPNDSTLVGPGK